MPHHPTQSVQFWCETCQWSTGGLIESQEIVCPKCHGPVLGINHCRNCNIGTAVNPCPICNRPIKIRGESCTS